MINEEKLKELILYIAHKMGGSVDEQILFRILWKIDTAYFKGTGKSLTGLTYIKGQHGIEPL